MSETGNVMEAIKDALAAAQPARVVMRELKDFNDHKDEEIAAGVFMLFAGDEEGFPNYRGREGNFGDLQVGLIAQIRIPADATKLELEEAESTIIDEIKAFTRSNLPAPIDSLVIMKIMRSKQLTHPYGEVFFDMEVTLQ